VLVNLILGSVTNVDKMKNVNGLCMLSIWQMEHHCYVNLQLEVMKECVMHSKE